MVERYGNRHSPTPEPVAHCAGYETGEAHIHGEPGPGGAHEGEETDTDATADAIEVTVAKARNIRKIATKQP